MRFDKEESSEIFGHLLRLSWVRDWRFEMLEIPWFEMLEQEKRMILVREVRDWKRMEREESWIFWEERLRVVRFFKVERFVKELLVISFESVRERLVSEGIDWRWMRVWSVSFGLPERERVERRGEEERAWIERSVIFGQYWRFKEVSWLRKGRFLKGSSSILFWGSSKQVSEVRGGNLSSFVRCGRTKR